MSLCVFCILRDLVYHVFLVCCVYFVTHLNVWHDSSFMRMCDVTHSWVRHDSWSHFVFLVYCVNFVYLVWGLVLPHECWTQSGITSHVALTNESRHTYAWIMSHVRTLMLPLRLCKLCAFPQSILRQRGNFVLSHKVYKDTLCCPTKYTLTCSHKVRTPQITRVNYEWVMSHRNGSCHIWMSHFTPTLWAPPLFGNNELSPQGGGTHKVAAPTNYTKSWSTLRELKKHAFFWSHLYVTWVFHTCLACLVHTRVGATTLWERFVCIRRHTGIYRKDLCAVRMSHVPYDWVMSRMNESCLVWLSHVMYDWAVSCMDASCHVWLSHVMYDWVMLCTNLSCYAGIYRKEEWCARSWWPLSRWLIIYICI